MVNLHLKNIQDRLVHLASHTLPRSLLSNDADAAVNAMAFSAPTWVGQLLHRIDQCEASVAALCMLKVMVQCEINSAVVSGAWFLHFLPPKS